MAPSCSRAAPLSCIQTGWWCPFETKRLRIPKKASEPPKGGTAPAKGPDTVSNRAVSQIEATGRVKIERDAGNATCQKAVYYRDEDKIVLTGDPVAWDKGTRVSGKRITMFLAEDRTVVEGGSHVRIEPEGGTK